MSTRAVGLFMLLILLIVVACSACSAHAGEQLTFTQASPPMLTFHDPCAKSQDGCYVMFFDDKGHEILRISQRTGAVVVAHPERSNENARQFWKSVEGTFNLRCPK